MKNDKLSIKKQKKAKIKNKKGNLSMKFYNKEHQNYFNEMSQKKELDVYNKCVVYLLGLTEETRKNSADIYNIEKGEINIEGLEKAWQTGTTSIICRLAFNLFNGYCGNMEEESSRNYTPESIFCRTEFAPYFYEAIKIRFNIID